MAIYGAHTVAREIASAITSSKITNAAALVGMKGKEVGELLKTLILPVLALTLFVGIMVQPIALLNK